LSIAMSLEEGKKPRWSQPPLCQEKRQEIRSGRKRVRQVMCGLGERKDTVYIGGAKITIVFPSISTGVLSDPRTGRTECLLRAMPGARRSESPRGWGVRISLGGISRRREGGRNDFCTLKRGEMQRRVAIWKEIRSQHKKRRLTSISTASRKPEERKTKSAEENTRGGKKKKKSAWTLIPTGLDTWSSKEKAARSRNQVQP